MEGDALEELILALDRLLANDLDESVISSDPRYTSLAERIDRLRKYQRELMSYTLALSQGDLDAEFPPRGNYLASGVKQLHAQLNHLTWQAQCIAKGDYSQHVDFMGDFSQAFNTMVDQLRAREQRILDQRDGMFRIFDTIESIILVRNSLDDRVVYANQLAKLRLGLQEGEHMAAERGYIVERMLVLRDEGECEEFDKTSGRWYALTCSYLPWDGKSEALLYHCMDITTHKMRQTDLERAANTDELTGLPNRRAYEAALADAWDRCMGAGEPLSMILFDIDYFKKCNDTYGHLHGDKCLVIISHALRRVIARSGDVIARFGGEEFVALLVYCGKQGALRVAESVRAEVESLKIPHVEDPTLITRVTISAGVCTLTPSHEISPTQLILGADSALYRAKQSGRNRVCQ